jgi:hypothetical protein
MPRVSYRCSSMARKWLARSSSLRALTEDTWALSFIGVALHASPSPRDTFCPGFKVQRDNHRIPRPSTLVDGSLQIDTSSFYE